MGVNHRVQLWDVPGARFSMPHCLVGQIEWRPRRPVCSGHFRRVPTTGFPVSHPAVWESTGWMGWAVVGYGVGRVFYFWRSLANS